MRGSEGSRRVVEPDRALDEVGRFPFVARPDVGVQEGVSVAQDLQVDATKSSVMFLARPLHRTAEQGHARQVGELLGPCQVGQAVRVGVIAQQYAVARQPLRVAHDCEPTREPHEDGRVLAPQCRADPVCTPVAHAAHGSAGRPKPRPALGIDTSSRYRGDTAIACA